ncbi:uncharacterized protein LOC121139388 [Mesocricetus auratus]|uniref:Uncharacterized protein LOC121139388 n=1 Tax=Mesocricetus auratus TaxID=10036 RepID=A0ABM2X8B3_MESAU|nr:uncharacterized protein LOC121139388 [Mesocricetus auratus]
MLLIARAIVRLGREFRGRVRARAPGCCVPLGQPYEGGNSMIPCLPQASSTPAYSSASRHCPLTAVAICLSHLGSTGNCDVSHHIVQTDLHTVVHYNKLLVCLKVSGFRSTINTGPSLRFLSDTLLLPRVRVMVQLGSASGGRFYESSWLPHTSLPLMSATPRRLARLNLCACSLWAVLLSHILSLPVGQAIQAASPCWNLGLGPVLFSNDLFPQEPQTATHLQSLGPAATWLIRNDFCTCSLLAETWQRRV